MYFPKLLVYFFYCSFTVLLFGPPVGAERWQIATTDPVKCTNVQVCVGWALQRALTLPDTETLQCFGLLLCPSCNAAFPPLLILQEKKGFIYLFIYFKLYLCRQWAGTLTRWKSLVSHYLLNDKRSCAQAVWVYCESLYQVCLIFGTDVLKLDFLWFA